MYRPTTPSGAPLILPRATPNGPLSCVLRVRGGAKFGAQDWAGLGLSWSKRNHRVRAVEKVGWWIQELMPLTGCAFFIGPVFPRALLGALCPLTLPLSSMAVTAQEPPPQCPKRANSLR